MRQVALVGLLSFLTLLTGGCTIGGDSENAVQNTATPSPSASSSPQKVSPSPTPFASPVAKQKPQTAQPAAGLISSLPPEERIKQIPKGRSDPFAAIPVQPQVKVENKSGSGGTTPQRVPGIPDIPQPQNKGNPGRTPIKSQGTTPTKSQGTTPKKTNPSAPKVTPPKVTPPKTPSPQSIKPPSSGAKPGSGSTTGPDLKPEPEFIPDLPKLPEATVAKQIKVEGVVQVDNQPSAIVKVPNEPSQYVKEGQRLSNGRVLVKRIEANRGPTPVVILEENGVEVAKRVGEEPTGTSEEGDSQTALIPVQRFNLSHPIKKT